MANTNISSQVPDAGTPIFDARGYIHPVWHEFFYNLLRRTGGTEGVDSGSESGRIDRLELRANDAEQAEYAFVPDRQESFDPQPVLAIDHGIQYDPKLHALVTTAADGFMSSADKSKLDGVTPGAAVASVSGTAPIVSSGGTTPAISITAATGAAAGSMSAADKTKLDGMTAGAAVSGVTGTAPIVSSGGTAPAISISAATTSAAGSLSAADKARIDQLAAAQSPSFVALTLTNGQLVFPATQVPSANANTLDDYEEGTYTPTAVSSVGTITTYVASGSYTKIGREVTATVNVAITTNGTGAGRIDISLPFTAIAGFNFSAGGIETSAAIGLSGLVSPATGVVKVFKYDATYPGGSGTTLVMTVTYFV